jgi:hypothetical protein
LTRSHHIYLQTIHIACSTASLLRHGVTYVNVYRRSLSSGLNLFECQDLHPVILAIETRKDFAVHVSLSSYLLVKQPGVRKPHSRIREGLVFLIRRQIATDIYRLLNHSSERGASEARKLAWASGPGAPALSGRVIGPTPRSCQRPSSRKCLTVQKKYVAANKPRFFSASRRTWATILRRSDPIVRQKASVACGKVAGFSTSRDCDRHDNVACSFRWAGFQHPCH